MVIDLANFNVLTADMVDEEGDLKVVKIFNCMTSATAAATKLTLGTVVVYAQDVLNLVEDRNQRIQDQQREIDSLTAQVEEYEFKFKN